jgi:transposase InsO family protein
MLDRGTQFTSHFWQQLHEALGTHLNFSSAYHPQTDGQTERTNQVLEDIVTPGFKGQIWVHLICAPRKNNTHSNKVHRDKCINIIKVLIT